MIDNPYSVSILKLDGWGHKYSYFLNPFGSPKFRINFGASKWFITNAENSLLVEGDYSEIASIGLNLGRGLNVLVGYKLPTINFRGGQVIQTTDGSGSYASYMNLPGLSGRTNGKKVASAIKSLIHTLEVDKVENQDSKLLIPALNQQKVRFTANYLGGYGVSDSITSGLSVIVEFSGDGLWINSELLSWDSVINFSIGGPGIFQTGGGWVGGGFGVKGALEGALFAGVMNSLTTRTHVSTVIRLIFSEAEINLHTNNATPNQLDIALSPLRGYISRGTHEVNTNDSKISLGSRDLKKNRYCQYCGAQRTEGAFCSNCGEKCD